MKQPHVGCLNQKLHLDISDVISEDKGISMTLESVHRTMKGSQKKLKKRAALRNITSLAPKIYNTTRCTGKYLMLQRFNRIREQIFEASSKGNVEIYMNKSELLKQQAENYKEMLKYFYIATQEVQNAT